MSRGYMVRFGRERLDYPELIMPNNVMVREVYERVALGLPEDEAIIRLWDYVARKIEYPFTWDGKFTDYHSVHAFVRVRGLCGTKYYVSRGSEEFFQFPFETIAWELGDCDDTMILLCSLLRNLLPPERVWAEIGEYFGDDHGWVRVVRAGTQHVLETTYTSVPPEPWRFDGGYVPFVIFNDVMKRELVPVVSRAKPHEMRKLRLIAARSGHPTKGV